MRSRCLRALPARVRRLGRFPGLARSALLLACLACRSVLAADFISVQSGSFDASSTWQVTSGTDADGIPDADDQVTINSGHEVTATSDVEANWITVSGKLTNAGPVELRLYDGRLYVAAGGDLELRGELAHQATVDTATITTGDQVTLSWPSPPFDPTTVPVGAKLMFLDVRNGDEQLSREAWHIYDVVAATGSSLTYSLGDEGNPVLGSLINNVATIVPQTPSAGARSLAVEADVPSANAYAGKFLEFGQTDNQYLIVASDPNTDMLTLYQPLRFEDANQTSAPVLLHNGVRGGDRFVIFEPVRVLSPAGDSDLLVAGPARLVLQYAEVRGLRRRIDSGALKIRDVDNSDPDQALDISYVDIRECNGQFEREPVVLLSRCAGFVIHHINLHDPRPFPVGATGMVLRGCRDGALVDSRIYRMPRSGFRDTPDGAITGRGTQTLRCLVHDILTFPLGGSQTDGVDFDATKEGRILDTAVINTGHAGIVFHSAEDFPAVPDPFAEALIRGCVALQCYDFPTAYNAGNLHPDRRVHAVDCVFGYGGVANAVFLRSVRYCVIRDSSGFGEYGAPLLLGDIFVRNANEACTAGRDPDSESLIQSCLFYDNRARWYALRHKHDAAASRLTVRDSTIVGLPEGSQTSLAIQRYPPDGGDVVSNILATNNVGIEFSGSGTNTMVHDYNLFHDLRWLNMIGGAPGPNSIEADPLFADPNAGDFRLLPGSPALTQAHRGAYHAGNIVRSWAMKVLGIEVEAHRDGRLFNDADGDGITDFGNVQILQRQLVFEFASEPPVVWPNSEMDLRIAHVGTGRSIHAVVPVQRLNLRRFAVTEETFGMLYQYIDLLGDVLVTLTHVGSPESPGTGESVTIAQTFDSVPYRLDGVPSADLGNLDGDGDIDLDDFGLFAACYAGAARPPAPACPPAVDADLDNDGDVDLDDFAIFAANYTGAL